MKFIHCADLHLNSKMDSLPSDKAKVRREEVFSTFERLCKYAAENDVTAVIISGDIFDDCTVGAKARERFFHAVSNAGVDFLCLTGNHDRELFFDYQEEFPENLKFFSSEWTSFRYGNVVISGIYFNGKNNRLVYDGLSLDSNDLNIVSLHGQVVKGGNVELSDTIVLSALKEKNIDYLALGHYHSYVKEKFDLRGEYCYCGCIEGRGFDETGDKGFVLIETSERELKTEFIKFAKRSLYETNYNLSGGNSWLIDRDNLIKTLQNAYSSDSLIKVVLNGEITPEYNMNLDGLKMSLNDMFFYVKIVDKTKLKLSENDYKFDKSIRGEFVRAVFASDMSEELKDKVLLCGLNALKGEDPL